MLYYTVIQTTTCDRCGGNEKVIGFNLKPEKNNPESIDDFCRGDSTLDDIGYFVISCNEYLRHDGCGDTFTTMELSFHKNQDIARMSQEIIEKISGLIKDNRAIDIADNTNRNIEILFNKSYSTPEYDDEYITKHYQIDGKRKDVDNVSFLLDIINKLSRSGSTRKILLEVDGDGSFDAKIIRTDKHRTMVPKGYGSYVPEECLTGYLTSPSITVNGVKHRSGIDMRISI